MNTFGDDKHHLRVFFETHYKIDLLYMSSHALILNIRGIPIEIANIIKT